MRYWDILRTANANLRKSKLRSFLTTSAVFMGALTLMLTTGVGAGLQSYVEEQVAGVGAKDVLIITPHIDAGGIVSNKSPKEYDPNKKQTTGGEFGMPASMSKAEVDRIEKTDGIKSVQPFYGLVAEYITAPGQKKYQVTISQAVDGLKQPLKSGRLASHSTADYEVTLPPTYIRILGFGNEQGVVGKTISLGFKNSSGQVFTKDAKVVGVQEKTLINNNALTITPNMSRDVYDQSTVGVPDFQKNQYNVIAAKFDTRLSEKQLKTLKDKFKSQGYDAVTLDDQLGIIKSVINGITTFLKVFGGIALAAASFGIINTLLMAVKERTREIGLMKALGMGKARIFALFSLEAVLIGFWGAIIALGAATLIGRIGSNLAAQTIFKDFEGLRLFSFPGFAMGQIILLIMVIAFVAATLPAWRASRLNPIDALRYE